MSCCAWRSQLFAAVVCRRLVGKHWQAWRAQPPRTPRRFTRLPVHRSLRIGGAEGSEVPTAAELVERSAALLSKRGYRVPQVYFENL